MNLGTRNNNWGNLRYDPANHWKGQTGQEKGYCTFDTVGHGLRAMRKVLTHYIDAGYKTVEDIIYRYAPPEENDTENYIANVCEWSGMVRDELVTRTVGLQALIKAMVRMETGNTPTDDQCIEMWEE